jgi:hypothetical protein
MSAITLTGTQALGSFFGVVASSRSYLNLLYLLLAFPLGVAYFCFLTVGWSLGLGLLIVWIGLIVLLAVLLLSWLFATFERQQAIFLLGAEVQPMTQNQPVQEPNLWERLKAFLTNRVTWTGMVFLAVKFPLGVASFVLAVVGLSVSLACLLAPFYYRWDPPDLYWWLVDTLPEALLCSLLGAILLILTLHLLNGVAWVWKSLAVILLGQSRRDDATPQAA